MIGTIMRLGWTNLTRDRAALFLTFLVPLVFFSIFALIFGNLGGGGEDGGLKTLRVLAVDEDASAISASFLAALAEQEGLDVSMAPPPSGGTPQAEGADQRWTRETAFREVRRGDAAAAVVVPRGFGDGFGAFGAGGGSSVELIHDASNPFAQYAVSGLLQAAAFQSSPGVLMERGLETLESFGGGGLTESQRGAIANVQSLISLAGAQAGAAGAVGGLVAVEVTAAHDDAAEGEEEEIPSMVAYYAAGIGVMFLLFSSVGAAGTLLEEQESGTLERLLASRLGMSQLLGGKWLFYSLLGISQVVLMFLWGAIAFGLDLFTAKRLAGFALMAVVTGASASAFALLLATFCKSRAQLGGVSTIVILVMSALGGSMVPRFVMPDFMDTLAKFTFNGWALDGFLKVFWYDDPEVGVVGGLVDLLPQFGVLAAATVVFLWLARRLARRWENGVTDWAWIESGRYYMALILWVSMPAAVFFWLVVHPLAGFWRRLGPTTTFLAMLPLLAGVGYLAWLARETALASRYPFRWPLAVLGLALYVLAIVIERKCRKHLKLRILVGVPELRADAPGRLLTAGIFAHTRNPRYLDIIIGIAGWSLIINFPAVYWLAIGSTVGLWAVVLLEERELRDRFGAEYDEYCRGVPRFVPRSWSFLRA